jgi:hypothetical protein
MASDGTLTFIVPVRHHASVADWPAVVAVLAVTLRSIAAQTAPNWRAVVVANTETELPALPAGVEAARVDLPYRQLPDQRVDLEAFYEGIRDDKGRRILAGIKHSRPRGHVMVVDYDDLVSNRLAALVASDPQAPGWFFDTGYLFSGSSLIYRYPREFYEKCGTSHVVRADLFGLPDDLAGATTTVIRRNLGSHKFIKKDLEAAGSPLAPLPMPGAIYRIGHSGSNSQSSPLLRHLFSPRDAVRHPRRTLRNAAGLRLMGHSIKREFFGAA